jgi:hypothetical protein
LATQESLAFAARLADAGELPGASTAVVDAATGQVYHGISLGNNPANMPLTIDPLLQGRMPSPSLEPWQPWNCAEFNATNRALQSGAVINNLYYYTVSPRTGVWKPPCANCTITTAGATAVQP